MDEPIVVMGICGSYDLDSANGRMLELILRECGKPVSYTHLRAHETREDRGWAGVG